MHSRSPRLRSLGYAALLATVVVSGFSAFAVVKAYGREGVINSKSASVDDEKFYHLLNRLTYGARPGDLADVKAIGIENFIQQQLNPDSIQQPSELIAALRGNEAINASSLELFRKYAKPMIRAAIAAPRESGKEELQKLVKERLKEGYKHLYEQIATARVRRAVESPCQLEELMTEFWFNHFNVSFEKGLDHVWVGAYEEQAIRPHVFGKFRELVEATSHHPAMLFYLDNWQNTKASASTTARPNKRFKGLNENYARELMELHTLGVDGGYTQQDVIELARILTGLGLPSLNPRQLGASSNTVGRFGSVFDSSRHDFGEKVLLGHHIKGSGEAEIREAIDILCRAPATADHISFQLAQYFVADDPPQSLVGKLSKRFQKTDGDIKEVLSELFHSEEFWNAKHYNAKFKNPYRYVISSLRAANMALGDYKPVFGFCRQLGMPLYCCLTPDGYKNTQEAWLSPSSLVQRINFATGLGRGRLPNNQFEPVSYKELSAALGEAVSASTRTTIDNSPDEMKSALVLGSPDFMNY